LTAVDKRLPLALAICLLILLGWNALFPGVRPPQATNPSAASPLTAPGAAGAVDGVPGGVSVPPLPTPKIPALETHGPLIAGSDEPDLVLTIGEPGRIGSYRATFSNRGGALVELRTGMWFDRVRLSPEEKKDPEHWTKLLVPVEIGSVRTASLLLRTAPSSEQLAREPIETALWDRKLLGTPEAPEGVEFALAQGTGVTFRKRFLFRPSQDVLGLELEIRNEALSETSGPREFVLTPAACVPVEAEDRFYPEPQAIAFSREKGDASGAPDVKVIADHAQPAGGSFSVAEPVSFAGVYNKYVAVLLHGVDEASRATMIGASWRSLSDDSWVRAHPAETGRAVREIVADVQLRVFVPPRGESRTFRYDLYAGPKQRDALERAWPDHSKVIQKDLGYFSGIASVLLAILKFFQSITSNWGVSIVLLTITVRGLLFPVNRRSQTAMARYQSKMKRLQPRIDEIKKRYAKDPTAQRQEQAKLMQEEGAFPPLGGCLPMFLQIPVFFGLFAALRTAFDLRQASFLWIPDLSLPDHTMFLGWGTVPILNISLAYLNILPPIMIAMWIWQQRGISSNALWRSGTESPPRRPQPASGPPARSQPAWPHESDRARDAREHEERDLLSKERGERTAVLRRGEPPCPEIRAVQRPVIEEQEEEGQGDQHGLGHEPEGIQGERRGVPTLSALLRPPDPCPQRKESEERAEHVLALGDPRHRFDVQRMHREQGGHDRAAPCRLRHSAQD
jgi:YidC/Oxa1 family membrane protein insertase